MARIPEQELERLKQEVSVQRLAEGQGIKLKRHGADLLGLCPFHDDKEPSLVITPKQNLWHCLGACQTGGSIIDWVMKSEGISFRHAVELLQADYQPLAANSSVKHSTVKKLPTALERNTEDTQLLRQVIGYYHEALKQSPEVLDYLKKRGISGEAIDHFKLGFANRTLGYRLPEKNRKEGAAIRGQLQRIGILRSSGHEHFRGSLVIPVLDKQGNVLEAYGRKINDNLRKGTPKHLYLPGPHAGVWNAEALPVSKEIILCESLIDALTFWCAGYHNVTCSYGTEGFTPDHLAAFKTHQIERVLIAYDRDEAGNKAADKLAKQLTAEGIDIYRLQFPKGMDVNEYALQVQPASKSLGVVIRSAQWMGKGKAKPITTGQAVLVEEAAIPIQTPEVTENNEGLSPLAAVPLPAAVVPSAPQVDIPAEVTEREIIITLGNRRYRVRGLENNPNYAALKVNLLVNAPGLDGSEALHVDMLDMYSAKARSVYIKQSAVELGVKEEVIKRDLGQVLLKLETLQEERLQAAQEPKKNTINLSDEEQQAALELLQAPDLMQRILSDFECCGVVGESTNILTGYLSCVSRKLDKPLAVLIQSTSAAGKSALMDAILDLMPEEERIQYSAMTGQSLFYMGESDLKHKVLAIAEEEGVSEAAYALKLLQSQGELTIASTGKDPVTGKLVTQEYRVEGPVMIFLTTTAIELDEELLNRCLVLTVNESREQTQAIQDRQRFEETLEGLLAAQDRTEVITLHRNAQRLLKPLKVVNPYADRLTFLSDKTRTRRDHRKYLTLIQAITLLHQYQREVKQIQHQGKAVEYIEVALSDIELANRLANEVLGRTLDELPPQTRNLLSLIYAMVANRCKMLSMSQSDYRFSRRDIREQCQWSDTALKVHMARLVELEYLLAHRGGRGQSYTYELLYLGEGEEGNAFLMGLLDVEKLGYDAKWSGQNSQRSGSGQPLVSGQSGGGQVSKNGCKPSNSKALREASEDEAEKGLIRIKNSGTSNHSHSPALVAQGAE